MHLSALESFVAAALRRREPRSGGVLDYPRDADRLLLSLAPGLPHFLQRGNVWPTSTDPETESAGNQATEKHSLRRCVAPPRRLSSLRKRRPPVSNSSSFSP